MIETFDDNTPTTKSEPTTPPLGLVPFDLVESVIYRDEHRIVRRYGYKTPGNAFADYWVVDLSFPPYEPPVQIVHFQHDTIQKVGVQGATNECLLAMVIDRLRCFQESPFACDENEEALALCTGALSALMERTASRKARGVEGTHTV